MSGGDVVVAWSWSSDDELAKRFPKSRLGRDEHVVQTDGRDFGGRAD
jgi:hypothetical protein